MFKFMYQDRHYIKHSFFLISFTSLLGSFIQVYQNNTTLREINVTWYTDTYFGFFFDPVYASPYSCVYLLYDHINHSNVDGKDSKKDKS